MIFFTHRGNKKCSLWAQCLSTSFSSGGSAVTFWSLKNIFPPVFPPEFVRWESNWRLCLPNRAAGYMKTFLHAEPIQCCQHQMVLVITEFKTRWISLNLKVID